MKRWADKKGDDVRKGTDEEYGLYNTLYLFGEFFGWLEVIRKEAGAYTRLILSLT